MKKTCLLLSILTTSVFASDIPPTVLSLLKTYQYESYNLNNGTLSLTVKKPQVTDEMALLFFRGVCETQFTGKPWKTTLIKQMEILNLTQDQSIKFSGGGYECKKIGEMDWAASNAYLSSFIKK